MERILHGSLSSSFSSVRRFRWALVKARGDGKRKEEGKVAPADYDDVIFAVSSACDGGDREGAEEAGQREKAPAGSSSLSSSVSSRFRAAVAGWLRPAGLGPRVTGTLFGRRRGGGHVHVAFQADPRACPADRFSPPLFSLHRPRSPARRPCFLPLGTAADLVALLSSPLAPACTARAPSICSPLLASVVCTARRPPPNGLQQRKDPNLYLERFFPRLLTEKDEISFHREEEDSDTKKTLPPPLPKDQNFRHMGIKTLDNIYN